MKLLSYVLTVGLCLLSNKFNAQDMAHKQLQDSFIAALKKNDSAGVMQLIKNPAINVNEPETITTTGSRISETGTMPLLFAIRSGNSDIVKALLDRGADVNGKSYFRQIKNGQNNTHYNEEYFPWGEAIKLGKQDIAQLLIERSKGNLIDDRGNNALTRAINEFSPDVVMTIINKGADINGKNNDGTTALFAAISGNNISGAQLLINKGADINVKDNNGNMPLMVAASGGNKALVDLLLSKGADINAKNNNGKSAVALAAVKEHLDIVKLLMDKGAHLN